MKNFTKLAANSTKAKMGAEMINQLKNNKDVFNRQQEMIAFAIFKAWKTGKMADCHPYNPLFKVKVSKDFMLIELICNNDCIGGFNLDEQFFECIESPSDMEKAVFAMAEIFTEKIFEMGIEAIEHECGLKNVA